MRPIRTLTRKRFIKYQLMPVGNILIKKKNSLVIATQLKKKLIFYPVQLHLPVNKEKKEQTRYQQM